MAKPNWSKARRKFYEQRRVYRIHSELIVTMDMAASEIPFLRGFDYDRFNPLWRSRARVFPSLITVWKSALPFSVHASRLVVRSEMKRRY